MKTMNFPARKLRRQDRAKVRVAVKSGVISQDDANELAPGEYIAARAQRSKIIRQAKHK